MIKSGALNSLVVQQAPTTGTAGTAIGSVKVAAVDTFGNLVSGDATVTLTATIGDESVTKTATLSHGVATITGMMLNEAGVYSIIPSVGNITGSSFNVAVSPANGKYPYWIDQADMSAQAGTAIQDITIAVVDAYGNLATTSSSTVTLKITGGKFANGTSSVAATSTQGFATFSNVSINAAGSYSLTALVGASATESASVSVTPSTPAKLAWKSAPAGNGIAGTSLNSISVAVQDAFGNVVTTDSSAVTLTLNSGTFDSGSSTMTVNAVNGVATFDNVEIDTTGTYKITASDSALTTVTSGNVVIAPGSLSSLSIVQAPSAAVAGVALAPIIKVAALDQYGNLVTAQTTVTIKLQGGKFSTNSETVTATTSKGIASFSGLIINTAGEYSIYARVGNLVGPMFGFVVTPAAGKTPTWVVAPGATGIAGQALDPAAVLVKDAFGNLATASSTPVTMKITGGKFADGSTSVKANTNDGVATFGNLVINTAGTYTLTAYVGSVATSSSTVTIAAADPAKLVWQTAPMAKAVAGTTLNSIIVAVKDSFGNLVTNDDSTISLTLNGGEFSSGSATVTAEVANGVATFAGLAINQSGTYTILASSSEDLTTVTSASLVISPSSLSSLSLIQSPDTATAGSALGAVKVAALDQYGNLVTASTSVTLTLSGGKFSTNASTATATTTGGFATFSNLIVKTAGEYSIAVSAGTKTGPSFDFVVNPAAASKLAWLAAPASTAIAGSTLDSVAVVVLDAFGNRITTDNSSVTLTLGSGTFGNGSSTSTVMAVEGIAVFQGLSINKAGSYKLTASDASLTPVVSGNLVITPASLNDFVFLQVPSTVTAGIALSPVKVAAVDSYGNLLATNANVTLGVSGASFADGSTSVTVAMNHGLATFSGLVVNKSGSYNLTVMNDSRVGDSANFTVNPASGKQVAWMVAPAPAFAGSPIDPVIVAVTDAFGNLATSSATNVTLKISGAKFSNGMTSISVASVNGYATFSNLTINIAGTYTLAATVGSSTVYDRIVVGLF